MVVCRNGTCAVGRRRRNSSNKEDQQGSTHQENKIALCRFEVLMRDGTPNSVNWLKHFGPFHPSKQHVVTASALEKDKACLTVSCSKLRSAPQTVQPNVSAVMAEKRRIWAMNTPPPHFFPQTHPECIQRGRTDQVHRKHGKYICHCPLSKYMCQRRSSCKRSRIEDQN